jgi:hypothetical protein
MFQEIPNIQATTFGGVIYGLNFQNNFSSSPSKLTLDIVSENGNYSISEGNLNQNYSVTFGSFNFNGVLWSFEKKYTAGERTLHLEIIDKSVILDRYYVLLWKRGLFGEKSEVLKKKTFDFSDQVIIVPYVDRSGWSPRIAFREVTLGSHTIERYSKKGGGKSGNVIVVGTEQFRDSECDIPTTDYNFTELKNELPISVNMSDKNKNYRSTHEGTLRSVLQSWASDFGYDFYWDYSSNQIRFFDVSNGITSNPPNYTDKQILEKSEKFSMEGTFRQYGISYAARPRNALESQTAEKTLTFISPVNPYPLSYFMSKRGYKGSIAGDDSNWGSGRSQSDFLTAALVGGYISKSLRNIFCFQKKHWAVLGYKEDSGLTADKSKCINFLRKVGGYEESITAMQEIDDQSLSSFNFQFISHDQGAEDQWHTIEAEMVPLLGQWYKCPGASQSFYYCNRDYILEIDITISPEGTTIEPQSDEFAGQNMLTRQGSLSHDSNSLQELLKIEENIDKIRLCAPTHIELVESGLIDYMVESEILSAEKAKAVNTLLIYPKDEFVTKQIGFRVQKIRANNDAESTAQEAADAQQNDNYKKCDIFEQQKEQSCRTAEEEAKDIVMSRATSSSSTSQAVSHGLVSKTAHGISISLKGGGNERFFAPSDAQYQFITTVTARLEKIIRTRLNNELISVNGSGGSANDVAEIRVAFDNMTDSELDEWGTSRKNIATASDVDGSLKQKKRSYTFAGEVPSLSLSPSTGLSSLDISLSSDGFKTSVEYSTRPPQPPKTEVAVRQLQSQFKRVGY